MGSLDNV
jgi:hypothetical protein